MTLEDFGTSLCCPESGWACEVQWNLNLFFLSIRTNAEFIEEQLKERELFLKEFKKTVA